MRKGSGDGNAYPRIGIFGKLIQIIQIDSVQTVQCCCRSRACFARGGVNQFPQRLDGTFANRHQGIHCMTARGVTAIVQFFAEHRQCVGCLCFFLPPP